MGIVPTVSFDQKRRLTVPKLDRSSSFNLTVSDDLNHARRLSYRNLLTIPENFSKSIKTKVTRKILIPNYAWYFIMIHLDLRFVLTKLRSLDVQTREFLSSLNSALFDMFWSSYGMCSKLRRSDLPGKLSLIPFLINLERNMMRAEKEKALVENAYQSFMEKRQLKHQKVSVELKRNAFLKK